MSQESFESEILKFWVEEGILNAIYKTEEIDLDTAKRATQEKLAFTKGRSFLSLVDYSKVKKTSKEARDYFTQEEASKDITALAILSESYLGNIIVNFYLKISIPKFPTKLFTNKEDAVTWLKNQK